MSYILDALKKSQQEREAQAGEQSTPNLMVSAPTKNDLRPWLTLATVLIFLLALWLAFEKFGQASAPQPIVPALKLPAKIEIETPIQTPVATLTAQALDPVEGAELTEHTLAAESAPAFSTAKASPHQATAADTAPKSPEPVLKAPEPEPEKITTATMPNKRTLPPLASLRKIPALLINSHIYSSIATQRSVTINNREWREGDALTADVIIAAITPQGVLLQVDGYNITVNRSQGWQPIDAR